MIKPGIYKTNGEVTYIVMPDKQVGKAARGAVFARGECVGYYTEKVAKQVHADLVKRRGLNDIRQFTPTIDPELRKDGRLVIIVNRGPRISLPITGFSPLPEQK
jgi:hypothetical protein